MNSTITHYADSISDPNAWFSSAKQLFYAAKQYERKITAMWNRRLAAPVFRERKRRRAIRAITLQTVYLMLIGFAIENLLKGILVKKNPQLVKQRALDKGRLPKQLDAHDLAALIAKTGIRNPNKELLGRLSSTVTWAGRYPLPKDPLDLKQVLNQRMWSSSDIEEAKKAVAAICEEAGLNNIYK